MWPLYITISFFLGGIALAPCLALPGRALGSCQKLLNYETVIAFQNGLFFSSTRLVDF